MKMRKLDGLLDGHVVNFNPILIRFSLSLGHNISQPKSIPERRAITYQDFIDPKWSTAHNLLSEILRQQIIFLVSECQYGLGSDELNKGIKQYMRKHPNFPQRD